MRRLNAYGWRATSTDSVLELQVADVVLFLARDREASVFRTNSTELGLPPVDLVASTFSR